MIDDATLMAGLDGSFQYDGHEFTFEHRRVSGGFRVRGTGAIQPTNPPGAAKYGPKRPPPPPKIPVTFEGYFNGTVTDGWPSDAKLQTTDGRDVMVKRDYRDGGGSVSGIAGLTTAAVREWRHGLRDAWRLAVATQKLNVLLRIQSLTNTRGTLESMRDAWLMQAVAYQIAHEQVAAHLDATVRDMQEPPVPSPLLWNKAIHDLFGYLREHSQLISDRFTPIRDLLVAVAEAKDTTNEQQRPEPDHAPVGADEEGDRPEAPR